MISFGMDRPRRRPNLTPMIDVVFLLLIFFMLASRFGFDAVLPVTGAAEGADGDWQGPPRLIDVAPDGPLLNGVATPLAGLPQALRPLMPPQGGPVILRPRDGVDLQAVVEVMDRLVVAGFDQIILAR